MPNWARMSHQLESTTDVEAAQDSTWTLWRFMTRSERQGMAVGRPSQTWRLGSGFPEHGFVNGFIRPSRHQPPPRCHLRYDNYCVSRRWWSPLSRGQRRRWTASSGRFAAEGQGSGAIAGRVRGQWDAIGGLSSVRPGREIGPAWARISQLHSLQRQGFLVEAANGPPGDAA